MRDSDGEKCERTANCVRVNGVEDSLHFLQEGRNERFGVGWRRSIRWNNGFQFVHFSKTMLNGSDFIPSNRFRLCGFCLGLNCLLQIDFSLLQFLDFLCISLLSLHAFIHFNHARKFLFAAVQTCLGAPCALSAGREPGQLLHPRL